MSVRFHSHLHERSHADVVIIGAGIVGLMTAFHFNREGIVPLIIERLPAPATQTSRRSGEGVRAQWELAHNIVIAKASIAFYRDLEESLGLKGARSGYNPVGYLYGSRTEEGAQMLRGRVARQREAGLDDVELIAGDDILRRFPLLAPDTQTVAFRQTDGTVNIELILEALLQSVAADIVLGTEVASITPGASETLLHTSGGSIEAGTLILANGARLAPTLSALGSDVRLRAARSTIIRLKTSGIPENHPATVDVDHGSFWRPDVGGARMTATFRGNLFVEDGVDDPPLDPDYLKAALSSVWHLVPQWKQSAALITDYHMRCGTFTVTEDGAPVIGPLPGFSNIFVNGGYGGHGVMMSPDGARRLVKSVVAPGTYDPFLPARLLGGKDIQPEPMTVHLRGTSHE